MLRIVVNNALYPNGQPQAWCSDPSELAFFQSEDPKASLSIYLPDLRGWYVAQLAAERYKREVQGIDWVDSAGNVHAVATDRASQGAMTAAFSAAKAGLRADPSVWKMADGTFASLSNADLEAMAGAVLAYVQKCFNNEQAIATQLDGAADAAALEAIDLTAGWPDPSG